MKELGACPLRKSPEYSSVLRRNRFLLQASSNSESMTQRSERSEESVTAPPVIIAQTDIPKLSESSSAVSNTDQGSHQANESEK